MVELTQTLFNKKDEQGRLVANTVQSIDLINRITFDTFNRVMHNWDPKSCIYSEESAHLIEACNDIAYNIGKRSISGSPFSWKLPTKENRKAMSSAKILKDFVVKFVQEHRQLLNKEQPENSSGSKKKHRTLIEELVVTADISENPIVKDTVDTKEAKKEGITTEELVDNICSLFFVSYDATSNTLNFILFYLATYPEYQEKLRSVLLEVFPGKEQDLLKATVGDIDRISFLTYFIDEVNRLCPLVGMFARDCIKDIVINEYEFKKGDAVLIDSKTIGCDSDNWNGMTDLDEFRPERWGEHRPGLFEGMMPFGSGKRMCPGRKIALAEIKCFIITVLFNLKIELRNPE
eukprot:CAMPEP_0170514848 /NCGR_PEP_ID=MMETSP0209-20121228/1378_1 /TAXON_ID=665100 ORGANISM="Litonotus pictus, Strain P1" /NCGR_SAMPLE_ID=MMETSP0209 /ASSEMBLY_ACC=CAM_ASM_000301 /LENGTH=347 /DNA_ID=CAMNT_0010799091 /DNA_START=421 /DNA_END=1461 /DNA_ORIENTATION=+